MPSPPTKLIFVTGTDTDCGKTTVSVKLLQQFQQQGLRTIGLKPLASGSDPYNGDVIALQKAASIQLPYDEVNLHSFKDPIAPHIAAVQEGIVVNLQHLVDQVEHAKRYHPDIILIEGCGGWCVPINATTTFADYVNTIGAEVYCVVGVKLGCINHATLTLRALQQDQVNIGGWIANVFDSSMQALDENLSTLHGLFQPVCQHIEI